MVVADAIDLYHLSSGLEQNITGGASTMSPASIAEMEHLHRQKPVLFFTAAAETNGVIAHGGDQTTQSLVRFGSALGPGWCAPFDPQITKNTGNRQKQLFSKLPESR